MSLFDKFKQFLGMSPSRESPSSNDDHRQWSQLHPDSEDDQFEPPFERGHFSFNMFTDPLEMHKYFEQQMGEMLRSFGLQQFNDDFSHHFGSFPQIQEIPHNGNNSTEDLRDQYLKPGYENKHSESPDDKKDRDIDGQLDIKDWGSVFKGDNQRSLAPRTRFFGQSVTSKTIRNPDGSTETHRTVVDNEGNEETTITRQMGDKEYGVIKRRDKTGKEEIVENLINLDEKDVDKFFPQHKDRKQGPGSLFDRFF